MGLIPFSSPDHLKALLKLTELRLEDTKVTATGVAALQAALPKCKIFVSAPVQAELEKMVKPSSSNLSATADRRTAEWVLGKGGALTIGINGQAKEVKTIAFKQANARG